MLEQKVDRTRAALRLTYGLVPIISGADKFANVLCDWEKYLSPLSRRLLPVRGTTFMKAVGVIEMGAGALVLSRYARLGGYVVGGWLGAIALQLGKPEIEVDTLNDVANQTRFTDDDLETAVKLSLDSQISSISALLGSIPIPAMMGLQMKDLSLTSDDGYVMMKGTLQ